jgi:Uma2 family endonuclease
MSDSHPTEPRFPQAPAQEEWDRLSAAEQDRVMAALPPDLTEEEKALPEGTVHWTGKADAVQVLRSHYDHLHRAVFLAADLAVYNPGAARFAPDVLAVFDVSPHDRMRWVVSHEKKGLDWVLEITVSGDLRNDLERNVLRYAAHGIPEYFIADFSERRVLGYRLGKGGRSYVPIVPQRGSVPSAVLGLELRMESDRLRFSIGFADLQTPLEAVAKLGRLVDEVKANAEARVAEQQARAEEERARADAAEARVRALEAELAKRDRR